MKGSRRKYKSSIDLAFKEDRRLLANPFPGAGFNGGNVASLQGIVIVSLTKGPCLRNNSKYHNNK